MSKTFTQIRRHHKRLRVLRNVDRRTQALQKVCRWLACRLSFLRVLGVLNPFRYIKRLDWYIIKKFVGTYFFSILLIISVAIVFDVNDNLPKFTENHAPLRAIVFDYYANFVPYFANLFSALFVFIAVIFFTSKMAGNSEIIAIMASGISFKRLLRPYMITCVMLAAMSYVLSAYVIPHGTVVRMNFENTYKKKKHNTSADNVQLQVDQGVIAYLQHYDNNMKRGYGFCLDKFKDKKLVSHLTAMEVQYDTIADTKGHWKMRNWKLRQLQGLKEHITSGNEKDTLLMMEPTDLVYSKGQQETFTSPELKAYISKQIGRGSGNVVQYQVEYYKRIASSFAAFILTIIGVSLSSRKRKGGMGTSLGIGLALSFSYIMLQTVSATFAIQAGFPPLVSAWVPNVLFAIVAYFCYRQAPR